MTLERYIILVLSIICFIAVNRCTNNAEDAAINKALANDTIRYYENKQGELIAQVNTLQLDKQQLKENINQLSINEKALKKQIGSLNNLVSYYRAKASVRDTFVVINTDTIYVDSAGNQIHTRLFAWSNKWMNLKGESNQFTTKIDYNYTIEWELVTYIRRDGFLGMGKKTMVSDLKFNDPNVRVNEFKAIEVPYKPKWHETRLFNIFVGFAIGEGLNRIRGQ